MNTVRRRRFSAMVTGCLSGLFGSAIGAAAPSSNSADNENASDAAPASPATDTKPVAGLQEIVVTARRREEKLSEAPVTVDAFSSDTIERAHIRSPSDFLSLMSNVNFARTTNAGDSAVEIRGVINPRDTEPPYALVIDGIQSANPQALNHQYGDIEQIEVLKGPQGALFGRNAVGGAIIVNTKKPTNDFTGSFDEGYGSYDETTTDFGVGGPIIADKLFFRASGSFLDRAGYYRNIYLGHKEDPYDEKSGRIRLIWNASEQLTLDGRLEYGRIRGNALTYTPTADVFLPFFAPANARTGVEKFNGGVDTNQADQPYVTNAHNFNNQERHEAAIKADYQLPSGTITLIGAYSKIDEDLAGDATLNTTLFTLNAPGATSITLSPPGQIGFSSSTNDGLQFQLRNQEDETAELRFTSKAEQSLRYTAGLYFANIKRTVLLQTADDTIGVALENPINGPESIDPTRSLLWSLNHNHAYAAFGSASYDVLNDLEASFSLRYDYEQRENINLVPHILVPASSVPAGTYLTDVPDGDPSRVRHANFDALQPKGTLRYAMTPQASIYGSYGTAFRSGGFNPPGSRALVLANDDPHTTLQDNFPKETSKSGEIGFKSEWFERRLSIDAAIFKTDIHNAHNFQFYPFASARVVTIVDRVAIKGFDLESQARISNGLSLNASFGYVDAKVRENANNPSTVGNDQAYVPNYTLNAGAQYLRPITSHIDVVARVDYQDIGPTYFNVENTPGTHRAPVSLVNASLAFDIDKWTVSFWGKNVLDKHYNVDAVVLPTTFGNFSFPYRAPPATYGVIAKYAF